MIDSTKIAIKAPDVTINVKPQSSDKVRTEIVNGRKCLTSFGFLGFFVNTNALFMSVVLSL